jgi:hypothetical protein
MRRAVWGQSRVILQISPGFADSLCSAVPLTCARAIWSLGAVWPWKSTQQQVPAPPQPHQEPPNEHSKDEYRLMMMTYLVQQSSSRTECCKWPTRHINHACSPSQSPCCYDCRWMQSASPYTSPAMRHHLRAEALYYQAACAAVGATKLVQPLLKEIRGRTQMGSQQVCNMTDS